MSLIPLNPNASSSGGYVLPVIVSGGHVRQVLPTSHWSIENGHGVFYTDATQTPSAFTSLFDIDSRTLTLYGAQ